MVNKMRKIEKQRQEFKAGKEAGTIAADMTFKAYQAQLAELEAQAATTTVETVAAKVEVAAEVVEVKVSKAGQAREMFKAALAEAIANGTEVVRKELMTRFQTELGMSKAGANTYYQNLRDEFHLSAKTKVAA